MTSKNTIKKTSTAATKSGISIKSRIKAGDGKGDRIVSNHNQAAKGLRIKSRVKAGGLDTQNHNQTARGISIKSRIRAGAKPTPDPDPR